MKKIPLCSLMLSCFIMNCLVACSTSRAARAEITAIPVDSQAKKAPVFHSRVETSIPLREEQIAFKSESGVLKAELYRPLLKIEPKTLVILVPGSGSVSRRYEVIDDGVTNYSAKIELYSLWAQALADQGFYVLAYDKRSCTEKINALCATNSRKDLDEKGIAVLARDLDDVYSFARKSAGNSEQWRFIFMGHTQAAQVIALTNKKTTKVSGTVLLSPIAGSLEKLQVAGLKRAASQSTAGKKLDLINKAEKTAAFFVSLMKGLFPKTGTIHGASVNFWKSWIQASENTIKLLSEHNQPTMILLSQKDVFSPTDTILNDIKSAQNKDIFIVKNMAGVDRNFISNNALAKEPIVEVIKFVQSRSPLVARLEHKTAQ